MKPPVLITVLCVCVCLLTASISQAQPIEPPQVPLVTASVETEPVVQPRDAADDPAIWLHPTDLALSTIIGTNKQGSLDVYDLSGHRLQSVPGRTGNVDLRYHFPLGGEQIDLVIAYSRSDRGLIAYKVNLVTRLLEPIATSQADVSGGGMAMYRSPITGKYYYFSNGRGRLRQYELFTDVTGSLVAQLVREIEFSHGRSEGVVADDLLGYVYVSEEDVGIWKLSAEPDGGDIKTLVDGTSAQGGHLVPDIEGLTIYYKSDGTGYLFASSQGNSTYVVYTRENSNSYIGTFGIGDGVIDGTSETDGIDITNVPLGAAFPYGMLVAQDGANLQEGLREHQNFKFVDLVQFPLSLGLVLDTTWDPRSVGL